VGRNNKRPWSVHSNWFDPPEHAPSSSGSGLRSPDANQSQPTRVLSREAPDPARRRSKTYPELTGRLSSPPVAARFNPAAVTSE
jgi:hypothetical protein